MRVITVNGLRVHHAIGGDPAGAPIVFANSLGTDLRVWDNLLPLLPPGLRVLRYDMRGHGLTDAPDGAYFMGDLVADAAALNRVALGTQTVTIWKDSRELGKEAAEIALALAGGSTPDKVEGAHKWTSAGGVELDALFLTPVPITKDNLDVVIDAGWIKKDALCASVPAGAAPACG